jgi:hypothetical protein
MKNAVKKLVVTGSLLAALVTTGCASLSIEGDSVSGAPGYLQGPDDNVAIRQMKESSYLGGE